MDDHTKFLGGCHDCRWRRRYFDMADERRLALKLIGWMVMAVSLAVFAGSRVEITINAEGFHLLLESGGYHAKDAEEQG